MSDLIERLKRSKDQLKMFPPAAGYFAEVVLDFNDVETLLSALETVRGIEGLAESGFVRIENGIMNQWHVTTNREWRSDQQETDAPTLSAAIEAARMQ